jgi:uncharacterized protein YprB with RNaseH-like and TPR domain
MQIAHTVNRNPMSKEFQNEAKRLGITGYEYSQLLKRKSHNINKEYHEYQKSPGQIKQMLIEKYRGKSLEDAIFGKIINTAKGKCYSIASQEIINLTNIGDSKSLIFDIETMGFSSVPIILIGLAYVNNDKLMIEQYLSRNTKEEPAILDAFVSHLREVDTVITFNGTRFDIPFVEDRLSHHKMEGILYSKAHHDALPLSRYEWKKKLPNCKLGTLEKHILGIDRKDDVPSRYVPDFYRTYLQQKNVGPLMPIIGHNRQDLITLAKIFSKLRDIK